jgi:hypothetical protein
MLVSTNEIITMRRLRMTPTKRAKTRRGRKRMNVTPDHGIEASKERKLFALVMWYYM